MKKLFSHLYHSFTFFIIVLNKNPTKIEKTVDGKLLHYKIITFYSSLASILIS